MENTGSKCDVCLGGDGQASASPQLLPLLTKHLGNFMRMKPVRACEACGQLLTLWDDFSRQARLNLAVSHPEAVKNSEQCEKDKQLLQAENSTQELSFPCDSTFMSPTANEGDIPDFQCPTVVRTEICTNQEEGSILKSILQSPEKNTGLEENKVAYLRQIKLAAPMDHQHFAMSKECCEESKPSEVCNEDVSNSETHEMVAFTEENSFTSDFMCKQTQTSTTMKSMEKLKTVQSPAIPMPQYTSILMPLVDTKCTSMGAVASVSDREENRGNTFITLGNFASADTIIENKAALQQNQIISTITKRSYANTTKIEYLTLGCLPCPTCSATLPTQKALHEHMMNSCLQNRHSQFICAFCAKQYNSKTGLSYHLMQHFTELSSIPCPVCKLVMSSARTLRSHQLRFHTHELPAPALTPCVFCKVMFCKSVLMKHYNNCRQNNLVVCLKKCNIAEQLSVFTCFCCYKIFMNKSDLLHHMESVHKMTYHSSSDTKFTCTLCSHKLDEVQDSLQAPENISVHEGTVNSQIISASDGISDSQVSSPSEDMLVNAQKISSSEEIVDRQMLPSVEDTAVNDQGLPSAKEKGDSWMLSPDENVIDHQIASSNISEDAESSETHQQSVQCQFCYRKFTVIHAVSHPGKVLTSNPTSDSNTSNEFTLANNEIIQKAPSLRKRQYVKSVPKKKLFKCKDCGKIFPYASWLQRHQTTAKHVKEVSLAEVGPVEPNSASKPDNKIADRVEVQQEQSTPSAGTDPQGNETSLATCKLCNRGFDKVSGLLRHLSYHGEKEARALKNSLLLERELSERSNKVKQMIDEVSVKPKTTELTCHMCFKTMETVKQLKNHIHSAHLAKNSRLKCPLCPFRFITPKSLSRHMVVHSSNNESIINLATQMDSASGNRMQHSYTKSKYTCKICFKGFNDSYGFQRHKSYNHNFNRQHSSRPIKATSVIKTFKCTLCRNKYPTVRGLNQHIRRFHNNTELLEKTEEEKVDKIKEFIASNSKAASVADSFNCTLCQNQYPTVRGLNQHLRRFHNSTELLEQPEEEKVVEKGKKSIAPTVVNNLPCDYCHLVFPSESALETHFQMDHLQSGIENVVSGPIAMMESPSSKSKIETSMELNAKPEQTGAAQTKKFGCNICNRFFFSKGRLHIHLCNAHQKRTKDISTAYQCKYCKKQLSDACRLKTHMAVMHASNPHSFPKSNFNCNICGRGVNTKVGLFRHMLHHRKWV